MLPAAMLAASVFFLCLQAAGGTSSVGRQEDTRHHHHAASAPTAYLVESLPVGNFDLDLVPGEKDTWVSQIRLVEAAQNTCEYCIRFPRSASHTARRTRCRLRLCKPIAGCSIISPPSYWLASSGSQLPICLITKAIFQCR